MQDSVSQDADRPERIDRVFVVTVSAMSDVEIGTSDLEEAILRGENFGSDRFIAVEVQRVAS